MNCAEKLLEPTIFFNYKGYQNTNVTRVAISLNPDYCYMLDAHTMFYLRDAFADNIFKYFRSRSRQ